MSNSAVVTLSQLESHLWESANILRGPVDAADFKTYIFPLLFFKRICDVWDEEYQEIVADTGDAELVLFPAPRAGELKRSASQFVSYFIQSLRNQNATCSCRELYAVY